MGPWLTSASSFQYLPHVDAVLQDVQPAATVPHVGVTGDRGGILCLDAVVVVVPGAIVAVVDMGLEMEGAIHIVHDRGARIDGIVATVVGGGGGVLVIAHTQVGVAAHRQLEGGVGRGVEVLHLEGGGAGV